MIELFDYQKEQVKQALNENKVLNQSGTGTGKTFVALEVFKQSKLKKLLVLCLASKVSDFAEDAEKIGIDLVALDKGTAKNKTLLNEATAVSISYESSWRLKELLSWVDKDTLIIADESHKLKSTTSKAAMFANKLSKKVAMFYCLSASMVSNGKYEDFWNQLFITGIYNKSFKDFKEEFCIEELQEIKVKGRSRFFNAIVGYRNIERLEQLVINHSVYKEREVSDELLPEDIFYKVKKPTMYGRTVKTRLIPTETGEYIELDNLPKLRNALLEMCSGLSKHIDKPLRKDKLERTQQILFEHSNERVVIFYNYNVELKHLKQLLTNEGRPFSEYNGHSHDLTEFTNESNGVVLAQYKSASTGINDFIIASTTIFFSSPDSSTTYIQAKGRTNRYGSTRKPIYYHLICANSLESKLFYEYVQVGKEFNNELLLKIIGANK